MLPPEVAKELLFSHLDYPVEHEQIAVTDALDRIIFESVYAPHELPEFRRSTMDGYAVRAMDTHGASDSLPAILTVIGEITMGKPADFDIDTGEAVIVHTGGMIPEKAEAVVQVEHTQRMRGHESSGFPLEIEVYRPVAAGQNVLQVGEDVAKGQMILPAGHQMRAQDIGGMLALGLIDVPVTRRPKVAILSTGDEVVPPSTKPTPGKIRDINSYTISALVQKAGGLPSLLGIVPDVFSIMLDAARKGLNSCDMLVISAGSSVSARDMTARIIDELGVPGVLLHGVATRPGKPTIVGVVQGKPILGLPGNPVSAMVQFMMFGRPAIQRLQGLQGDVPQGIVWARVDQNIASESGREDYVPATISFSEKQITARPIFGKSNLIFTLINAVGLIKIPLNVGGVVSGDWVEVRLF